MLDLGRVEGVAEVFVNGLPAGRLLSYPFEADVSKRILPGVNDIEVKVYVPLRNKLIGKALSGDPGAAQFQKKKDLVVPVGMLGPTVLRREATESR